MKIDYVDNAVEHYNYTKQNGYFSLSLPHTHPRWMKILFPKHERTLY